jgi:hypothetical protein
MYRITALFAPTILAAFAAHPVHAQTIEGFSAFFAETMAKECKPIQRAASLNDKVTDAQIDQYCSCVGRHSV